MLPFAGQKYCRMLQEEHSAILLTFIKLPLVIKIFVLSIFDRQFYIGFTVLSFSVDLEKENIELKEQRLCKICMVSDANVVFLPCGHLVSCASCAPALQLCPICRAVIKGTVRTYLS